MAISVRAEPDPDKPLGHARLVVAGLKPMPADTGFIIRREGYERGNLGPRGWQVSETQLEPRAARQQGDDTILLVGPEVVRHMEAGPIMFIWPAARVDTVLFWPDDIDVFDGELPRDEPEPPPPTPTLPQAHPAPQPAPIVPPAPALAPPPPAPPKTETDRRDDNGGGSNKAIAIIFALLVIGAAAGAGWYFLYGPGAKPEQVATAPTPPPAPQPTPQPQPAPPTPPPALAWPEGTDSLTLQELVAKAPNAQGVFDAALRRQGAGRHDDALVLLEEAAEKGHAPALTALARLYDPVGFEAGKPFRSPDPRAAARYYRDAVQKGDAPAEAKRAALKTWLEGQAASNPTAAAALKEFWP